MWGYGLDRAGSAWGQLAGTRECGSKPSGSIKCGEISWLAENRLASQEALCSTVHTRNE